MKKFHWTSIYSVCIGQCGWLSWCEIQFRFTLGLSNLQLNIGFIQWHTFPWRTSSSLWLRYHAEPPQHSWKNSHVGRSIQWDLNCLFIGSDYKLKKLIENSLLPHMNWIWLRAMFIFTFTSYKYKRCFIFRPGNIEWATGLLSLITGSAHFPE